MKEIDSLQQEPFIEKADLILQLNKDLQEVNRKFNNYFSGQYKIEKCSKKLENWSELTLTEFVSEINKTLKTSGQSQLSKKDEFDWTELFEENKTKAQNLKTQIATNEDLVDKMVYELYGLTQSEIDIVES